MTNNEEYALLPLAETSLSGASLYTDILCGLTSVCGLTTELDADGRVLNIYYDNTYRSCKLNVKDGRCVCENADDVSVMVSAGGVTDISPSVKKAENVALVDECLKLCIGDNDDEVYRIFTRSRKGFASVFYITDGDGEIISTGSIVARNKKFAVIGNIYTAPGCRNKGYAGQILEACVSEALSEKLIPALYCSTEMKNYYFKRGFSEIKNG